MSDDKASTSPNMALGQGRISETERRIIYLSLILIVILAVLMNYTQDQTTSLVSLFFIVIIAIANIIYFASRRKSK